MAYRAYKYLILLLLITLCAIQSSGTEYFYAADRTHTGHHEQAHHDDPLPDYALLKIPDDTHQQVAEYDNEKDYEEFATDELESFLFKKPSPYCTDITKKLNSHKPDIFSVPIFN